MRALSKDHEQRRSDLVRQFTEEYEKLTDIITDINALIDEKLNGQVDTVNGILAEMRDLHEEITDAQQEFYDDKSEKWQESDTGENYQDWMSVWQGAPPPDDIEPYETLEEPDIADADDEFENLPSSPND